MASMALLVAGCSTPTDEPAARREQPIVGGRHEASFASAGYLVRDGIASCSASLIEPDVVITAGHCVEKTIKEISFGWGEVSANTTARATLRAVHPRYIVPPSNAGTLFQGFDIALLRLEHPLDIEPVAVEHKPWTHVWSRALGVGYGATSYVLHAGKKLEPTGVGTDRKSAEGYVITHNPTELFVRFESGSSPCYGDSGSPLLTDEGKMVGVLSRFTGATRCRLEDHTLMGYIRVDAMEHFLHEAKVCLAADDVARCLREDQRGLCASRRASNRDAPEPLVPEQDDPLFGSRDFELGQGEERSLRTRAEADVKLHLFSSGDARMRVLPVGQNVPIADDVSETKLETGREYELVVRSCNGRRQSVTLSWSPAQPDGGP
jgi:hypothetical protein